MRRWLAILLRVLLPTQMSWAVLADYCAHGADGRSNQPGVAADHAGHHDHAPHGHGATPEAVPDAAGLDDGGLPADAGVDCGHCHGHCADMLVARLTAPLDPAVAVPVPAAEAPCAAPAPAQPERPQWARLA